MKISLVSLLAAVLLVTGCGGTSATTSARPSGVPAAGASPTIDRILKAGYIKVGVLADPPWLVQSTSGAATSWSGSSWTLAEAVAKALGVTLRTTDVGQDTKITSVQTGQIDISITPLSETPAREKVVTFITYSVDGYCWFALSSNAKVNSIADFKTGSNIVDAEIVGGAPIQYVPQMFPKIKILQVVAGPGEIFALEPVLTKTADIASFDSPLVNAIAKKYPQLKFIPAPADCISSPLFVNNIGWAINNQDPVFASFLNSVREPLQSSLDQQTAQIVASLTI